MASQVSPSTVVPTTPMEDKAEDGPNGPDPNRWFFEKERLETTPSRKCGIDADKELTYRQQSANFIQDMGQRLQVNQLCINTAIVYMHRFYMYHSFSHFHRNHVSTASIFLAAKVEEQPRKLEHVIKVAHYCLNRESPPIDTKSENYAEQTSELVMTENILLQTLGFDINIDHPHTHVVKCCQLVRASKDLAQTSYFMATNSLHLTTMCLQYKPTVVACVCIHLTCKWSNWEIPRSKEGRDWFWYVDDTVTIDQLEKLTTEFLTIFDKSPSRLKKKILSLNQTSGGSSLALSAFPTLNMDPTNSPGAPHSNRSHSPATPQPGSNSTLGKRSGPSIKPGGSQVNSKQPKVNGGIGHHSIKPPHGSQVLPSTNSSSKHPHYSSSGSKGVGPPGSHHGAKDAHNLQQHGKPLGHHHSGHPTQAYPHGSSNRPSSSHSHSSGHHSQGHAPPTGQPPKPPSSTHAMSGQQHPSKPLHQQPSKVPYNYNTKSQPPAGGPPPPKPSSSSAALQTASNTPVNKSHQPPSFNQVKKPYQDSTSRRENPPDFNGRRENSEDINRRNNLNSQHSRTRLPDIKTGELYSTGPSVTSNLPAVSLPFNSTTTSEPSRIWGDSGNSVTEPRIPAGRPSSLFSPDPELIESSNFLSSSIQSIVKSELSPIGDTAVGAKGGDVSSDNPFSMPPAVSSSELFPNLFEFGMGGRSSNNEGYFGDTKPELTIAGPSDDIKPELAPILSTVPVSTSSLTTVSVPMNLMTSKTDVTSPASRVTDTGDGEPSHKKIKKNKKEKHKHKDKEKDRHEEKKDRKDKEEKKHKDKNRDKSRDDKKHKEKHKKEKHKEKERDRSKAKGADNTDSPGCTDPAGTGSRIKINLGSRMLQDVQPIEKQKSKHSSKKHSSKSNPAAVESSNTPSIKLKIVPLRPPTNDDKVAYTSKPN